MPFTQASLGSGEVSARDENKPVLGGPNALRDYQAQAVWSTSGDWADSAPAGASNADNSSFPTTRLHDEFGHVVSTPAQQDPAVSTYYLLLDLDETIDIDHMLILGHNLGTLAGTVTLTLIISDNADFTSSTQIWQQAGVSDDKRIAVYFGNRYTTPRYLRLQITSTTAFSTVFPRIGELYLGRRYQLSRQPDAPWDPDQRETVVRVATSQNGVTTIVEDYRGRAMLRPSWGTISSSDPLTSLDDRQTFLDWWDAIDHGRRFFTFCRDPLAAQANTLFVRNADPNFTMPYTLTTIRQLALALEEQNPFLALE